MRQLSESDIKAIEEMFDMDISEIDNFQIATYFAVKNCTLPDFSQKITKYFDPDTVTIETRKTIRRVCPILYGNIVVENNNVLSEFYKQYNDIFDRVIRSIIDINFDLYKSIDGEFDITVTVVVKDNGIPSIVKRINDLGEGQITFAADSGFVYDGPELPYIIRIYRGLTGRIRIEPEKLFTIQYN